MKQKLVIVESPAKCKTIGKILGSDFVIKSTLGHIRDLPAYKIGVDIKAGTFTPEYEIMKDKKRVMQELISSMKKSSEIYIATDEDREGEAIGWHVMQASGLKDDRFKRITFHEITQEAIKKSIKSPRDINIDLVDAQQARRVLDRLVGYKLSPLLAKKIYKGLSAGRVQSVSVRIIVEREREINKFVKEEYWSIKAECSSNNDKKLKFFARFVQKSKTKFKRLDIKNKKRVDDILKSVDKNNFVITNIEKKERKRNPYAPFITSTLQQSGSGVCGFSSKKTMVIAQQLYEGINLGDSIEGLITYMRTDSPTIAVVARKSAAKYIEKSFGKNYLPAKERIFKAKSKNAQEAHECIRPTDVNHSPAKIKKYLGKDQYSLYKLIWDRFVASQMKEALYQQETVEIKSNDTIWHANGQVLLFDGFLKVYMDNESVETRDAKEISDDNNALLPVMEKGEKLNVHDIIPEQHFTDPPPRYTEATLIKAMEGYGIGRPSTYAPTISTIVNRGYVRLEKKRFFPEDIGVTVTELLEKHFSEIVDINFTANMEEDLDKVADGKKNWLSLIKDFYKPFAKKLELADTNIKSQKVVIETDKICPKCGAKLLLRESKYGKFLACGAFPKCKYTESADSEENKKIEQELEPCPECKGKLVIKNSKFGKFIACSNYPKCRYSRPTPENQIDKACPECGKPLVMKFSRRGKFLGCSGYPTCKHLEQLPKQEK